MLQGKLRDQLPGYGVEHYHGLFTPRQLLVLLTLIKHIRGTHGEMLDEGIPEHRAQALTTYFAMAFDRRISGRAGTPDRRYAERLLGIDVLAAVQRRQVELGVRCRDGQVEH